MTLPPQSEERALTSFSIVVPNFNGGALDKTAKRLRGKSRRMRRLSADRATGTEKRRHHRAREEFRAVGRTATVAGRLSVARAGGGDRGTGSDDPGSRCRYRCREQFVGELARLVFGETVEGGRYFSNSKR